MRCVVFFSGGLMSWAAAMKAVARYGADNVTLLFTDTLIEDPDLYRFLEEASAVVGAPLITIAEGRDPWSVFRDVKFIGNTRKDPCSKYLKRLPALKWLEANADPENTMLVFGIHWEEAERFERTDSDDVMRGVRPRYAKLGWPHVWAPMCETPWMSPKGIGDWAAACGLTRPRLYDLGFIHNNCGGFCVKAGEGQFANLLKSLPDVYARHEAEEDAFNAGRPGRRRQTVLAPERMISGKRTRVPMSMAEFRKRVEAGDRQINMFDVGGCGCFLDDEDDTPNDTLP